MIISSLLAICGVLLSCFIIYHLCKSKKNNKQKENGSDVDSNQYELGFKRFSVVAVVLFAFSSVFIAIYCILVYVEFDANFESKKDSEFVGWGYIFLVQRLFVICSRSIVLYICNARLYYTFRRIPELRVSKRFYYVVNILTITILPILAITGFIAIFFDHVVVRICIDGYRYTFIILLSCVAAMFNKKLYKKTMDRQTVRDFKMSQMMNNEIDKEEDVHFEFMRTATGRSSYQYMRIMDDDVYVLLDIITRYSVLIFLIDLSVMIYAICWNIRWFTMKHSVVTVIFPAIYGSFDSCLNSLCLLLFYSYGDKYYKVLCQCNDNKKCKYCGSHYCVEKCCVGLAKRY